MKVVILAGGLGTRLAEETARKPKPMVEIGGRPMIWHIMNIYAAHGFKEFVVALGYKGEVIKDYFLNYHHRSRSLSVNLHSGEVNAHNGAGEDWTVHLLDTGAETQTGGRVKQAAEFIGREPFMLTYGDGVSNVDIGELIKFHKLHGRLVTMTAVRPSARFGQIAFDGDKVKKFEEKSQTSEGWVNGGFFVLEPEAIEYIDGDDIAWERQPMERLSQESQVMAYRHPDFWQCMDTLRDVQLLNTLWKGDMAPWKIW